MKKILIINIRDSFVYNIVEAIRTLGHTPTVIEIDKLNTLTPKTIQENFHAAIISPGGGTPSQYPTLQKFIQAHHKQIPMLGICLGHQAICQHFGATLYQTETQLHGAAGSLQITTADPIFNNTQKIPATIGLYHSWAIDLPQKCPITPLAIDHRGVLMMARHRSLPIYTMQFHPESYISGEFGMQLLRNWTKTL